MQQLYPPQTQPQLQPRRDTQYLEPYEIISTMQFAMAGTSTYARLLNNEAYDKQLKQRLQEVNFDKLNDQIYLFNGDIQPDNVQWKIWKHPTQMTSFVQNMTHEIAMMKKYPRRLAQTGAQIDSLHKQLKGVTHWTPNDVAALTEFMNLLTNHPFLRKSVVALTFVEHCMPLSYWHLKVFQQINIFKDKNFLSKIINSEPEIDKYLTVTGDGILISTKNLLETKIDRMVPFTNQFQFSSQVEDSEDLTFNVSSCTHENLKVNFKEDYIGGINFHLGVRDALIEAQQNTANRFKSFSRVRQNCATHLYNDGEGYFKDVCDQLNKARTQVLITDWWMTPYFLLKRPDDINHTLNRLDGVLKHCGDRGVKVFIILFREPLGFLCNDSYDAQIYLESLSRNIRIRRHPIVPQKWSHHEKCIVIDQRVAFMGGLDICYGRWDTPAHHITNVNNCWDGGDYTNERIRAFLPGTTKNFTESPVDRTKEPRMPWHDIGLQLRGDAVLDLARHFIQYWYFVDAEKVKDPYNHLRNVQKRYDRASNYEEPDWEETGYDEESRKDKKERSFGEKFQLCGTRTKLFFTGTEKRLPQLLITARSGQKKGEQQLQLCRSASPWSIGARQKEDSIHVAYQTLIKESENFIYIQNQFFMGREHELIACIAERIQRAHKNRENFKIIVVMPLLPGFEGAINAKTSGPLRIQVHNQFEAIHRGQKSLFNRLKHLPNFNVDDYIHFFGLRNHGRLNGQPVTEIIYVHSKLMIVDDKRCIIGSANINDRSLMGDRDSELAIVIQENNGQIYGIPPPRKGIFDLRQRIFNEHFGLTPEETASITSPQIWNKILTNANRNSEIYFKIFGCYPDNSITVSQQIQERIDEADIKLYDSLIPQIFGHAVDFPLHFMEDQDLEFQFGDKEGFAGPEMFL